MQSFFAHLDCEHYYLYQAMLILNITLLNHEQTSTNVLEWNQNKQLIF